MNSIRTSARHLSTFIRFTAKSAAGLSLFATLSTGAASFDCAQAFTKMEAAICESPALSNLDSKLGAAYAEAKAKSFDPQAVVSDQRAWVSKVRSKCTNESCLVRVYEERLAVLAAGMTQADIDAEDAATAQHQGESKPGADAAAPSSEPASAPTSDLAASGAAALAPEAASAPAAAAPSPTDDSTVLKTCVGAFGPLVAGLFVMGILYFVFVRKSSKKTTADQALHMTNATAAAQLAEGAPVQPVPLAVSQPVLQVAAAGAGASVSAPQGIEPGRDGEPEVRKVTRWALQNPLLATLLVLLVAYALWPDSRASSKANKPAAEKRAAAVVDKEPSLPNALNQPVRTEPVDTRTWSGMHKQDRMTACGVFVGHSLLMLKDIQAGQRADSVIDDTVNRAVAIVEAGEATKPAAPVIARMVRYTGTERETMYRIIQRRGLDDATAVLLAGCVQS